jgi:hypothetical protein
MKRVSDLDAECEQWHVVCREQRERIAELEAALREIATLAVQDHTGVRGQVLMQIERLARGALSK